MKGVPQALKMNEMYARRLSQTAMFHNTQRMLPCLYRATQVTKEKLDNKFVEEEFMRINGHRTQHLLIPENSVQKLPRTHWNDLHDTATWTESMRAQSVRFQTPLTRRCAEVALIQEPLSKFRSQATIQAMFLEQVSRTTGIAVQDKAYFELLDDEEEDVDEADENKVEQVTNTDAPEK